MPDFKKLTASIDLTLERWHRSTGSGEKNIDIGRGETITIDEIHTSQTIARINGNIHHLETSDVLWLILRGDLIVK